MKWKGALVAVVKLDTWRLSHLERQFAVNIANTVLKAGLSTKREGRVYSVEAADEKTIYGAVNGFTACAVVIDAADVEFSTCTCGAESFCKHIAAVFFAYCDTIGRPSDKVMQRMIQLKEAPEAEAQREEAAEPGNPPQQPEIRDGRKGMPNEGSGPDAWSEWFERMFGDMWHKCSYSINPLQEVLLELKSTARDWEPQLQRLHWLHALLFVFGLAERAYAATDAYNKYYYEVSFRRTLEPWVGNYNELVQGIHVPEMADRHWQWAGSLAKQLRERASLAERQLLRWDELYYPFIRMVWSGALFRSQEKGLLQALLAPPPPGAPVPSRAFAHSALSLFAFRAGEDEEAIGHLEKVEFEKISGFACSMAGQRLQDGQSGPFKRWMAFIYSRVADTKKTFILQPYLALCRQADRIDSGNGHWMDQMAVLLPHSYNELSAHYLERGLYEQWADLQMFIGIRADDIDAQDMRIAAKSSPASVIPLYHQAIDELIAARNRQSYKQAAKLLKKLDKAYQSVGGERDWQRYLEAFVQKYQRLRALQEELWKGKLIT